MSRPVRHVRRLTALAILALALLGGLAAPAHAAGDVSIDHSELTDGRLRLLVSVPAGAVDLASVAVTVDGAEVESSATAAASSDEVRRRTVLAIDTSNSMKGARIAAAKSAALTFLDTVPANVEVGVVTFDNDVVVRQQPTVDRDGTRAVVNALSLSQNTALYEGVETAITTLGDGGQRQVLLLSDGQDNTKAPLEPVIETIKKSGVKVDAVALEQGSAAPQPLAAMTEAGGGTVVSADTDALAAAFTNEAAALARQVLVTADVPEGSATDGNVEVSLVADGVAHSGSAFLTVRAAGGAEQPAADPFAPQPAVDGGLGIPPVVMYAAVAAIGLGALGLVIGMVTSGPREKPISLDDQLAIYSASEEGARISRAKARQATSVSITAQAKAAAEKALSTNVTFEARLTQRLEGAGMALKSSEWLLLHLGIGFGAGLFGLLISGGNPLLMVLFVAFGFVGPWLFLALKRSRRLKAFDSGLADTLQLMSGSLSAGLSLAQSLDTIVREGQEPITSEFKRVIVESRLGVTLEDALEGVAERMQSTDFKWVVMAIRIQREVGGNLAELLNTVAATLREREYLRRHVSALSAEGRLSAWILGGLPPGFLAYLSLSKPDYVEPMYTEPIGWLMLGGMTVLLVVGIVWMSKVAKVEV